MAYLLGILGGMGPLATVDLYAKIIAATPASCDQEHLPVIIDADPTVPDRSAYLRGLGPDPLPKMLTGAQRLARAGVSCIVIPCNTAHAFLPALRAAVSVPFIDMIAATAERIVVDHPSVQRVGILATIGTLETGLYDAALRERGLNSLYPSAADQAEVMAAIHAVKGGDTSRTVAKQLIRVGARLVAAGAELLIAGCTELPLVLKQDHLAVPLIDPTQVLAEAAIREARRIPVATG